MPTEIFLLSAARALVEVAGMLMLGQGILWCFGSKARDGNFVYDLLKKGTSPITRFTRLISPRFIHDAHIGLVAFFLVLWLWIGLAFWKHSLCTAQGLQCA